MLPLYELVILKDTEFCAAWTSLHDKHFQQSKYALAADTCYTDASDTAVRAVLQQHINCRRLDADMFIFTQATLS